VEEERAGEDEAVFFSVSVSPLVAVVEVSRRFVFRRWLLNPRSFRAPSTEPTQEMTYLADEKEQNELEPSWKKKQGRKN
jgi:hypothetical protein